MSKEAMKQALELLKSAHVSTDLVWKRHDCVQALEEALAKQEQGEPVAWEKILGAVSRGWCHEENANKTMDIELAMAIVKEVKALYTTPQRTWVGLTEQEQGAIMESLNAYGTNLYHFANAIEAKLKEKNT